MNQQHTSEEKKNRPPEPEHKEDEPVRHTPEGVDLASTVAGMQDTVGNRAVQRLLVTRAPGGLAQRSGDGPSELDDATAGRINRERGGGQPLDGNVQASMGEATGHDFSGVKVHTSPESDALSQNLGATAFTTGQDVFFRAGAYDPGSSSGQQLLAHELTHVVQQGSGSPGGGGRMTVNAPGDAYEQEADSVSKALVSDGAGLAAGKQAAVQREAAEEEPVQMQAEEDEPVQMQAEDEQEIQKQPAEDGEEALQMQTAPEDQEPVQMQAEQDEEQVQMQAAEETEEEPAV
jgi:hypothetical protein